MKVCKKCKEEKELSEYKHSKMKDGYFSSWQRNTAIIKLQK
jgi:hypothetical protein